MSVPAAALAFSILSAGIAEMKQGDIAYTGPTSTIGVIATNIPSTVRLKAINTQTEVFAYSSQALAGEAVNVKIRCYAVYDGPQVQMTVQFPSDGMRARFDSDVHVTVGNPLSIETADAPEAWQRLGIAHYPIVRIPFSVFVDEPWPADNYKATWMLVMSGMAGFGAPGLSMYEDYQVTND
ncbi:MAG: hypothetical protein ABIQ39_13385 [Ilumatobacteraceae bacterium]